MMLIDMLNSPKETSVQTLLPLVVQLRSSHNLVLKEVVSRVAVCAVLAFAAFDAAFHLIVGMVKLPIALLRTEVTKGLSIALSHLATAVRYVAEVSIIPAALVKPDMLLPLHIRVGLASTPAFSLEFATSHRWKLTLGGLALLAGAYALYRATGNRTSTALLSLNPMMSQPTTPIDSKSHLIPDLDPWTLISPITEMQPREPFANTPAPVIPIISWDRESPFPALFALFSAAVYGVLTKLNDHQKARYERSPFSPSRPPVREDEKKPVTEEVQPAPPANVETEEVQPAPPAKVDLVIPLMQVTESHPLQRDATPDKIIPKNTRVTIERSPAYQSKPREKRRQLFAAPQSAKGVAGLPTEVTDTREHSPHHKPSVPCYKELEEVKEVKELPTNRTLTFET